MNKLEALMNEVSDSIPAMKPAVWRKIFSLQCRVQNELRRGWDARVDMVVEHYWNLKDDEDRAILDASTWEEEKKIKARIDRVNRRLHQACNLTNPYKRK